MTGHPATDLDPYDDRLQTQYTDDGNPLDPSGAAADPAANDDQGDQ